MSKSIPFSSTQLENVVEILDHLRIPINGGDRLGRFGTVPYYGANGLQGWIDHPIFDEPLILLAEDGGNFDDFATRPIAYRIEGPSWVNNHAHILRAKPGYCQSFIYWSLVNKDIRKFIAGGTRSKLNQGELKRIEIQLPDESEQTKIAQVLDTLDTAIRQTEAIIEKLKQVKQGLLHDLLTRGVDANGELRPSYEQAPHLYQKSLLGWIPKDWAVVPLSRICEKIGDGVHYAVERSTSGVPFLFVSCIRNGEIIWGNSSFVSSKTYCEISKRNKPQRGMILFTVVGSYGHAAHVDDDIDFGFERNIAYVVPNAKLVYSNYLFNYLTTTLVSYQVEKLVIGNAQKVLTLASMNDIVVLLPSITEQSHIAQILALSANREKIESEELDKLNQMKAGLMDDLLTGRVRVTPLLKGAVP